MITSNQTRTGAFGFGAAVFGFLNRRVQDAARYSRVRLRVVRHIFAGGVPPDDFVLQLAAVGVGHLPCRPFRDPYKAYQK